MTWLDPAPITGAKTVLPASATTSSCCAFSVALWNGKDPILKERAFGLTNSEANHGEDLKEYYFYLDSTPTHSYMKYLYKYPQAAFPYLNLIETNRGRNRLDMEYELLDTGIFNEDRYFDVFVEYAKQGPEDMLIQISVVNRGPGGGRVTSTADALVSQHLDVVARYRQAVFATSARPERYASHCRIPCRAGRSVSVLRGRCPAAVYGERDQQSTDLRQPERLCLRQRRNQQLRG